MEHWEFLIQKEGDRAWLPLESPTVEILEGRYRVIARSDNADTLANIEIVHQYEQDGFIKQRVQKRSQQLNHEGLLAVMPFTYLQPGLWKLACAGIDPVSETCWQRIIQLQVLLQETDDWGLTPAADFSQPVAPDSAETDAEIDPAIQLLLSPTQESATPALTPDTCEHDEAAMPMAAFAADEVTVVSTLAEAAAETIELPPLVACTAGTHSVSPKADRTLALSGRPLQTPELPQLKQPAAPLNLRPITGPTLPPQLHPSYHRDIQEPQLPGFAASQPILAAYLQSGLLPTAIEARRSPVELAFAALQLRQRFWSTLNLLAQEGEPLAGPEALLDSVRDEPQDEN